VAVCVRPCLQYNENVTTTSEPGPGVTLVECARRGDISQFHRSYFDTSLVRGHVTTYSGTVVVVRSRQRRRINETVIDGDVCVCVCVRLFARFIVTNNNGTWRLGTALCQRDEARIEQKSKSVLRFQLSCDVSFCVEETDVRS
jgi:hypothetical protein